MMWPRLELLRDLLAEDGCIWASIDNTQGAYLKVLLDFLDTAWIDSNDWDEGQSETQDELGIG